MFMLTTSCLKLLVLSYINIDFQTNLQTLFEDLGWNKYVTNIVSLNASVALHLKANSFEKNFSFQ